MYSGLVNLTVFRAVAKLSGMEATVQTCISYGDGSGSGDGSGDGETPL